MLTRRAATEADREYCRSCHHLAYRDVVERGFGPWDDVRQDGFFADSWRAAPHEMLLWDGQPAGYVGVDDRAN